MAIRHGLLRRDPIEGVGHVGPDLLVPVLVDAERAARVLHEQVHQPDPVRRDLRQGRHHLGRDQVAAARAGGQGEGLLEP